MVLSPPGLSRGVMVNTATYSCLLASMKLVECECMLFSFFYVKKQLAESDVLWMNEDKTRWAGSFSEKLTRQNLLDHGCCRHSCEFSEMYKIAIKALQPALIKLDTETAEKQP